MSPAPKEVGPLVAVVMGDIIGSQTDYDPNYLHRTFNAVVEKYNMNTEGLISPLTITLGDEFQGICAELRVALSISRKMRLDLLRSGVACRFVAGYVKLDTPLNRSTAWNMMGRGLPEARRKLSEKRHPSAYRFSLPDDKISEVMLDIIGYQLTQVELSWTERQLEVVVNSMDSEKTNAQIAVDLGMSERNLYKSRRAANYEMYSSAWNELMKVSSHFDARNIECA